MKEFDVDLNAVLGEIGGNVGNDPYKVYVDYVPFTAPVTRRLIMVDKDKFYTTDSTGDKSARVAFSDYVDRIKEIAKAHTIDELRDSVNFNDGWRCYLYPQEKIVIITSEAFRIAREASKPENFGMDVQLGDGTKLSAGALAKIKSNYEIMMINAARSMLYATMFSVSHGRDGRIAKAFSKSGDPLFMSGMFVPVFIKSTDNLVPDVLRNLDGIQNSKIYQMTVGTPNSPRLVQLNSYGAEGYMLTHKEISECFGLKSVVRWKARQVYELLIGRYGPFIDKYPHIPVSEGDTAGYIAIDTSTEGSKPRRLNDLFAEGKTVSELMEAGYTIINTLDVYLDHNFAVSSAGVKSRFAPFDQLDARGKAVAAIMKDLHVVESDNI